MTKAQSKNLVPGARVEDIKYGLGKGTVKGVAAGPAGYWNIDFDSGQEYRLGYRSLSLIKD